MDPSPSRIMRFSAARLPWATLAVAIIIIAMYYPGIMSNDSHASLNQARTLEFDSWHPPIMALIWSLLDRIYEGPTLMLVSQAALYAIAASKLCVAAFPSLSRRFSSNIVVLGFALFPPALALNGMIWKDVWMSGLLLLALAYLFRLAAHDEGTRGTRLFVCLVIACLLATAFRHNAVAATAGLLAGGCYLLLPKWSIGIRLFSACVAGVILAFALLMTVSGATRLIAKPAHVTTPILLHDIAGIIVKSGTPQEAADYALTLSPELASDANRFVEQIHLTYTPAEAGKLVRARRKVRPPFAIDIHDPDHDAASVKRAWLGMIKRYPRPYLKHRAHAFSCLLQLCGTESWAIHSYVLNQRFVPSEGSSPPQSFLRQTLLSPALVRSYAPALWLLIVLVGGVIGLARARTNLVILVFMALSAAGVSVSLFFSSPIESYRYMHWVILTGWTMLWLAAEHLLARRSVSRTGAS